MTAEQAAFGPRMKGERERRGIDLDAIVASTKIKRSLLEGLERNDLSRWPHGLFGRSYIRDYARALGLQPELIVAEFRALFPEASDTNGAPLLHEPRPPIPDPRPLRLTLAVDEERRPVRTAWLVAAAIDASVIVALATLIALIAGVRLWTAVGGVSLVYFAASTAWKGRSFAAWWLEGPAKTMRPPRLAWRGLRREPPARGLPSSGNQVSGCLGSLNGFR